MRHRVASFFFIVLALAISGCGPRITNDNLQVVDDQRVKLDGTGKGLSPKEVESILGQPSRQEMTKLPLETQKKEVEVIRYYYVQDGEEVLLHFVDNKLINEVPRFGMKPAVPPQK